MLKGLKTIGYVGLCAARVHAVDPVVAVSSTTSPATDSATAQVYGDYVYEKPGWLTFLEHFPGDYVAYGNNTFRQENFVAIGAVLGMTAVLYYGDD
jgi:hypothetical protein